MCIRDRYTGDPELIAAAEAACAEAGVKALVGKIATGDLFVGDSETKAAIEAKCACLLYTSILLVRTRGNTHDLAIRGIQFHWTTRAIGRLGNGKVCLLYTSRHRPGSLP